MRRRERERERETWRKKGLKWARRRKKEELGVKGKRRETKETENGVKEVIKRQIKIYN